MRLFRPSRSGAAWAFLLAACAGRPPQPVSPALEVIAPPLLPEPLAVWRPVPLPPRRDDERVTLGFHDGMLVFDEVGARWFFPDDGGPPRVAPGIVPGPIVHQAHDPSGGLLFVTAEREVWATDLPAAAARSLIRLPETAVAASVTRYRGALAFVAVDARGATTIHRSNGEPPAAGSTLAAGPPGYRAKQIAMDGAGVGVGLFLPERVFTTGDGGATWEPVDTTGLRITTLLADGDRVLLVPGGERDDFARSIVPGQRTLERVQLRQAPRDTPRGKRTPRPPPWARGDGESAEESEVREIQREIGPGASAPPGLHRWLDIGGRRSLVANDGDDVLAVLEGRWKPPLFLHGRIGEGVRALRPADGAPCDVVSVALCDGLAAVSCADGIRVFRGERPVASFEVEAPTQLAFDAAGHLLTVARDPATQEVRFRVRDLGGRDESETRIVFEREGSLPRFVGGCHRPGLWLANEGRAARWGLDGFDEVLALPSTSVPVAVARSGSLVLSDGTRLLRFPDGVETLLGKHEPAHVSFADDGDHGLFVSAAGQVHQTDDGGLTFTPIATPPAVHRPSVRCGGARCQLESGLFREGFGRDAVPVAAWPSPSAAAPGRAPKVGHAPTPEPADRPDPSVFMRCTSAAGVFASSTKDKPSPRLQALWPRLGAFVFVGGRRSADGASFGVFGERSGRASTVRLPQTRIPAGVRWGTDGSTNEPEEFLELAGVVGTGRTIDTSELGLAQVRWSPRGPILQLRAAQRSALGEHVLVADEGVAVRHHVAGELVLLGDHPPERRLFAANANANADGVLQIAGDGSWIVATDLAEGVLRVVRVPVNGAPLQREITVRQEPSGEHGVGVLVGDRPHLVSLEERASGGHELRLRPLADDLSLGDASTVPGTVAERGALLDLPACAPGARGGLTRLRDTTLRRFAIDNQLVEGFVQRLARVSPEGACIERTVLARSATSLDARIVVTGVGGLAISTEAEGGLRCEPTAVSSPISRPLSSAAAEPPSTRRRAPKPSARRLAGD